MSGKITAEEILSYLESRVPSVSTFVLRRLVDATGVSGVGVVADGAVFPDGKTVTRWRGGETGIAQTCVWDNLQHVRRIHGHDGLTRLEFVATGELVAALAVVVKLAQEMEPGWRAAVLEAVEDALIDEIPGAREKREQREAGLWGSS
jgi:hypothetical protein